VPRVCLPALPQRRGEQQVVHPVLPGARQNAAGPAALPGSTAKVQPGDLRGHRRGARPHPCFSIGIRNCCIGIAGKSKTASDCEVSTNTGVVGCCSLSLHSTSPCLNSWHGAEDGHSPRKARFQVHVAVGARVAWHLAHPQCWE